MTIISKYSEVLSELTRAKKDVFKSIYTDVKLTQDSRSTIIDFYNKVFLPRMKPYILSLDSNKPNRKVDMTPKIPNLRPSTSLRQNLPPNRLTYSTTYPRNSSQNGPLSVASRIAAMTPGNLRTKTLYTFGESSASALEKASTELRNGFYKQAFGNLGKIDYTQ